MINVKMPNLDIECDITFNEKGLSVDMKKFNINNFTIDKVFKYFDKKYKKKDNKKLQEPKQKYSDADEIEEASDDDLYTIKIE